MANFNAIMLWVLQQEDAGLTGKIVNLGDNGGRTRFGIAETKHTNLPADFYTSAPAVALLEAEQIYKGEYWNRFLGDQVQSDDVASCLLSFSINDGEAREVIMLQEILGVTVDGDMGPVTLSRTNSSDATKLAAELRNEQANFYLDLAKRRMDIAAELPGLLARARRVYPSLA